MHDAFRSVRMGRAVQSGTKLVALAGLVAGCASQPARLDAWGGGQNCHFAHVTKQEFQTALHRVFGASGPKVYGLRPEEGGALVEQHWALDVVFASSSGAERWRLQYAPAGDGVDVHADVEDDPETRASPLGKNVQPLNGTANYRLLWSRIQYVLGGRTDWPECKSSRTGPGSALCSGSSGAPVRLAKSH